MLPHDDLRLLARFEATEEWLLEPGDILYVPPRVPHNGVAVGDDCMTYSVGFRAPSRSELIAHWSDHLLASLQDDDRYQDPPMQAQANPGEIAPAALAGLHAMILERMSDADAFARWFGEYTTARKYPDVDWRPEEAIGVGEVRALLTDGAALCRNPASRFSFVRQDERALLLFVDGECFECVAETAALAEQLCAADRVEADPTLIPSDTAMALIAALLNQGSLAFEEED
jgi:50S ribosomal protein L16 3-hydroxylase